MHNPLGVAAATNPVHRVSMDEREEILATVASLYYRLDQSQADIAKRLGVSTSKISRMLKAARDRGIVDIRIHMPIPRDIALEQELISHFNLRDALVLQSNSDADDDTLLSATGQMAASYLQRTIPTLPARATIGVAWGTSIFTAIAALGDMQSLELDVAQIMGGLGLHNVDGPDIARTLAARLGGRHYDLPAPAIVERPESRAVLMAEPAVREALHRARSVGLAIAGIGAVQDNSSAFLRAGVLTRADLAALRAQGAVGEMVGQFYQADGSIAGIEINERMIGLALSDLRRIPYTLAVARGLPKVDAIYGALRGHYVSVLATDDVTARAVLASARVHEGGRDKGAENVAETGTEENTSKNRAKRAKTKATDMPRADNALRETTKGA